MGVTQFEAKGFLTNAGNPVSGQRAIKDFPFLSATFSASVEGQEDIRETQDGNCKPVVVQTIDDGQTWQAEFSAESITARVLELAMGEEWALTGSYVYYPSFRGTVAADGSFINIPNLGTTLTAADISVSVLETGAYGPGGQALEVATTGSATATKVILTPADSKLQFTTAYAGKTIKYAPKKTLVNAHTLGIEETYELLTSFRFMGQLCSDNPNEKIIVDTDLQAILEPEFTFGGGKPEITLTYKCVAINGARSPIRFIMPAVV